LTAKEAGAIYAAGLAGKDLAYAVVPGRINFTVSGSMINLSWNGGPNLKLQKTANLNPPAWVDVPGTLGASSISLPITNSTGFFKLSQ
jgi:hypothetical protein